MNKWKTAYRSSEPLLAYAKNDARVTMLFWKRMVEQEHAERNRRQRVLLIAIGAFFLFVLFVNLGYISYRLFH